MVWVYDAGGTFALYSLLCRHAKLSLILNQQTADAELSTYKLEQPPESTLRGEKVRKLLEEYSYLRTGLLILVLLGTCMVIGDGILTPSIAGNLKFLNMADVYISVKLAPFQFLD